MSQGLFRPFRRKRKPSTGFCDPLFKPILLKLQYSRNEACHGVPRLCLFCSATQDNLALELHLPVVFYISSFFSPSLSGLSPIWIWLLLKASQMSLKKRGHPTNRVLQILPMRPAQRRNQTSRRMTLPRLLRTDHHRLLMAEPLHGSRSPQVSYCSSIHGV